MAKTTNLTKVIVFRATPADKQRYAAAAKRKSRKVSDWIREVANRAVDHKPKRVMVELSDAQAKHILALISANQTDGWHVGDQRRWRESLKDIESQVVEQIG